MAHNAVVFTLEDVHRKRRASGERLREICAQIGGEQIVQPAAQIFGGVHHVRIRQTRRHAEEPLAVRDLEPAQKRYEEVMALMASEELYADAARFDAAMQEYEALSKKIPKLEEEWLELTTLLEEAQADA